MALVRICSRLPLASVTVAVTRSRNLHDEVHGSKELDSWRLSTIAHQREQTNNARTAHGVRERVVAGFQISCTMQLCRTRLIAIEDRM